MSDNLVNYNQKRAIISLIANQQKKICKSTNPDIYEKHIDEPEFWICNAENYYIDELINSSTNYAPPYKIRSMGLKSDGFLLEFTDDKNKEKYIIHPNGNVEGPEKYEPSGGCYVATAVYGSYDCPEVWTLRRYRDNQLATTWYGRLFIHTYYAISPTLVKWFGNTQWFKNMWKPKLDKMVSKLQANGVENTPYDDIDW